MSIDIPFASDPRPDTGVTNASLGMWLFIASEVMLFGALFSSYALLRIGAAAWPDQGATLNVPVAAANTVLMVLSSGAMLGATAAVRGKSFDAFRRVFGAAFGLGALFLVVKAIEYRNELADGLMPSTSNFLGLYFTMTGLHALHVAGGLVVMAYLWLSGRPMWHNARPRFASRIRTLALYWNFIDVVWLTMFVVLYLL